MLEEFKKAMAREFEIKDMGLMSYYLGIEVKQNKNGIFISQEGYAKEVKRFNMDNCNQLAPQWNAEPSCLGLMVEKRWIQSISRAWWEVSVT